ncbi:hypothetical protein NPIL_347091 [Nephila pilipes]|uniref:Uncharacterized protein n=1 Tax=Nephila pilipes TaxID=299642 RepID=A0A8X6P503_NEPPI|nr:hypothetical protein NPIL_347091 [Nephila pilipes]
MSVTTVGEVKTAAFLERGRIIVWESVNDPPPLSFLSSVSGGMAGKRMRFATDTKEHTNKEVGRISTHKKDSTDVVRLVKLLARKIQAQRCRCASVNPALVRPGAPRRRKIRLEDGEEGSC